MRSASGTRLCGNTVTRTNFAGNDPTVLKRQDAVGTVEDTIVMRDKQRGRASLSSESLEQIDDLSRAVAVQRRGRFICQNHGRIADESTSDGHALLLPTRIHHR